MADLLVQDGWSVLARNWRAVGGELDLVVERDGALRFVEVKARAVGDDGLMALTPSKRAKLRRAAEAWLVAHGPPRVEVCFLVAVVTVRADGRAVEWLDDPW